MSYTTHCARESFMRQQSYLPSEADYKYIMIFASITFILLFLPVYILVDRLLAFKKSTARNVWLLAMSLLFYVWGEATNVILLLGMGVANYLGAFWIEKAQGRRVWPLIFMLLLNLACLFFFKYMMWFLTTSVGCLEWIYPEQFSFKWIHKSIAIPLGISFFTFHAISYLLDVYRRQIRAARSILDFMTYFCMFPHLVAGPIVRYAQVQQDLGNRGKRTDKDLFSFGMYRFLQGLNKKVLIANSAAVLADSAFSLSQQGNLAFYDAWIGIFAYTIQIYYDFSGYSDMAIGLAAMAGFHFEENFLRPYSSTSIREFWRRWHISLSSWLRDYLYFPLGGSRCSAAKTYRNLLLIFLVCGIWHGANFTFVIWGLWHGFFLVGERVWNKHLPNWHAPHIVSRLYAILVVMIGWVFFRADSMGDALSYLSALFRPNIGMTLLGESLLPLVVLLMAVVFCLLPDKWLPSPTSRAPGHFPTWLYVMQAFLAIEAVALLAQGGRNPFIYFNF